MIYEKIKNIRHNEDLDIISFYIDDELYELNKDELEITVMYYDDHKSFFFGVKELEEIIHLIKNREKYKINDE
jgi:hypothetical protein